MFALFTAYFYLYGDLKPIWIETSPTAEVKAHVLPIEYVIVVTFDVNS